MSRVGCGGCGGAGFDVLDVMKRALYEPGDLPLTTGHMTFHRAGPTNITNIYLLQLLFRARHFQHPPVMFLAPEFSLSRFNFYPTVVTY
jgi:hypothetical protein